MSMVVHCANRVLCTGNTLEVQRTQHQSRKISQFMAYITHPYLLLLALKNRNPPSFDLYESVNLCCLSQFIVVPKFKGMMTASYLIFSNLIHSLRKCDSFLNVTFKRLCGDIPDFVSRFHL